MDAAPISRPEGGSRERSRLWKVGVVFAIALGFIMAMLEVTVVNVALADVQPRSGFPKAKNLERILQFFDTDYPDLKDRRILIVDDEADLTSIRFVRKKDPQERSARKIARSFWGEYNSHSSITLIV
jgi:hypothetical protein